MVDLNGADISPDSGDRVKIWWVGGGLTDLNESYTSLRQRLVEAGMLVGIQDEEQRQEVVAKIKSGLREKLDARKEVTE